MKVELTVDNRKWGESRRRADVVVDVKLTRREGRDGWNVTRRDNGHDLGWLVPDRDRRGSWKAFTANSAYWPADADIMVRTDHHRSHRGESWAHGEVAGYGETREEAIREILYRLFDRWAEGIEKDFVAAFAADDEKVEA